MPNWCYNNITITGDSKNLKKIKTIVEMVRTSSDAPTRDKLFQSLIGLPEDTDMDNYNNQGWYDTNVEWFGTKWDVGADFVQDITDDYIFMSGDTAWSPPINFCVQLSKRYGVEVEMYYEEPGSDFCGKTHIDSEGNYTEEDYSYQEGVYRFDGYNEWYDREFGCNMDYLVDCLTDNEMTAMELLCDHYGFLTEDEKKECANDLEEYVKNLKESEQQV